MGRHKKRRSRGCFCCGRGLANERFSGKNHGRRLCRKCARLPPAEREHRVATERLCNLYYRPGKFRRKRPHIERYLTHDDPRVRQLAQQLLHPPDHFIEAFWDELDHDEPPAFDPNEAPPDPPWALYEREALTWCEPEDTS